MLTYAIKSMLVLSVMYVPYALLLRKESFFRFNRLMLLLVMLLSLVLPMLNIHALDMGIGLFDSRTPEIIIGMPTVETVGENAVAADAHNSHPATEHTDWWSVVYAIYITGLFAVILLKTVQALALRKKIHESTLWVDRRKEATIYCHARETAPFSWMRSIVIGEDDYHQNGDLILGHELGHIRHHHSLDIILLNICQIVQWANPFVWMLASSLRDVHEYEADDSVLRSGVDLRQYQRLLIKKAVGSSSYAFANSFNHSLLKKRFTMMLQKKSSPWMRAKALYVIPMALIALSAFATPLLQRSKTAMESVPAVSDSKVTEILPNQEISMPEISLEPEEVAAKTEVVSPIQSSDEVNSESLTLVDLSEEKRTAETVVPADTIVPAAANEAPVLDTCEVLPEYEGGFVQLMTYLQQTIRYPKIAHDCGVQGGVIVSFIVNTDGSCSDFEIRNKAGKHELEVRPDSEEEKGVTVTAYKQKEGDEQYLTESEFKAAQDALSEESLRVLKSMSRWKPGTDKGKPVRVRFTLPIKFRLQ